MKNFFKIFILIFSTLLSNAHTEEKIGIINIEYIMQNSIAGKSIQSKISKISIDNNKYFKENESLLKKKEEDIFKQKNVLSKEEFDKSLNLFKKEIQAFRNDKSAKINKLQSIKIKSINELLKQLSPLVAQFAKDNNIIIVIDKKYTVVSKVEFDITKKILVILDKKIKKIDIK
jgi:Skp family chaperone for outer membrane proteins